MSDHASAGLSPALAKAVQTARAVTVCTPSIARRAIACLDLTRLNDDDTETSISDLCARASTPCGDVAAVCVYPAFIAAARKSLAGRPIRIATVVNFPNGTDSRAAVLTQTQSALNAGADEIDLVLPHDALFEAQGAGAKSLIAEVCRIAGPNRPVKTILEISRMPDLTIVSYAAALSIDAGTKFVKTSTGKVGHGATLEASAVMLDAIRRAGRPNVGLKPSGGIRTAEEAAAYITLADTVMGPDWATPERFRIGASGVVDALVSAARCTDAQTDQE